MIGLYYSYWLLGDSCCDGMGDDDDDDEIDDVWSVCYSVCDVVVVITLYVYTI